ncbi:hypothetical protein GCM10017771_18420 [Streptomyces capitiformicae]|uniref:Uncharacterized protein n=1 Tax=Streptomyces capitiformicae TaxID=2014920 RepID=A0A919GIY2_9ACTN|nr:hypothetical protein GCM10017771_18420 [Streptomyces capitiformicae]
MVQPLQPLSAKAMRMANRHRYWTWMPRAQVGKGVVRVSNDGPANSPSITESWFAESGGGGPVGLEGLDAGA